MSTIELINVHKQFGTSTAVADFNLTIAPGELVTLLGPSGSGKSTILSMIAGLTQPTSGEIRIGGRDVTNLPPAKRNIGMVFQSYALFPHMTVFENVAFALVARRVPRSELEQRVERALRQVRLHELSHRKPAELSGGQQQRVALARAIVFQPEILLLDEPMGALDKNLREEVQLELLQLQRHLGITALMVTHDQEEALSLSNRIVVIDKGRIQQAGTPSEVYQRPKSRFVAEFIGTANLLRGEVFAERPSEIVLSGGIRMDCDPSHGQQGAVQVMLRPEHVCVEPSGTRGLTGTVIQSIYLGRSSRVHVRTDGGQDLVAIVKDWDESCVPGAPCVVNWTRQRAWVIPALSESPSRKESE
jgi:putative spermidine/putrescine transport system ATP-binding protein